MSGNKVKHPCKICLGHVSHKNGLQCQGACKKWAHYQCLNYTPGKISDIKAGILKVLCPCPNCDSSAPKEYLTNPPYTCSNQHCPVNMPPICPSHECPRAVTQKVSVPNHCPRSCKLVGEPVKSKLSCPPPLPPPAPSCPPPAPPPPAPSCPPPAPSCPPPAPSCPPPAPSCPPPAPSCPPPAPSCPPPAPSCPPPAPSCPPPAPPPPPPSCPPTYLSKLPSSPSPPPPSCPPPAPSCPPPAPPPPPPSCPPTCRFKSPSSPSPPPPSCPPTSRSKSPSSPSPPPPSCPPTCRSKTPSSPSPPRLPPSCPPLPRQQASNRPPQSCPPPPRPPVSPPCPPPSLAPPSRQPQAYPPPSPPSTRPPAPPPPPRSPSSCPSAPCQLRKQQSPSDNQPPGYRTTENWQRECSCPQRPQQRDTSQWKTCPHAPCQAPRGGIPRDISAYAISSPVRSPSCSFQSSDSEEAVAYPGRQSSSDSQVTRNKYDPMVSTLEDMCNTMTKLTVQMKDLMAKMVYL